MQLQPISKNRIKHLQSLKLKKYRQRLDRFTAEGRKVVKEIIIDNNLEVRGLYAVDSWFDENEHFIKDYSFPLCSLSEHELHQISSFKTPDQVLIECSIPDHSWPKETQSWMLFLDAVQDPGNLGSILRSADWFGVEAVFLNMNCVDPYNPKTVHATMGSVGRVPVIRASLAEIIQQYQAYPIYQADITGDNIYSLLPVDPGILIIGNETHGITLATDQLGSRKISIPRGTDRKTESLNVAMATTALLALLHQDI